VAAAIVFAVWCFQRVGQELFPEVDSSEFTIHLRAAGGPRVETTEAKIRQIDALVREVVPPEDLRLTLANIGISSRWVGHLHTEQRSACRVLARSVAKRLRGSHHASPGLRRPAAAKTARNAFPATTSSSRLAA